MRFWLRTGDTLYLHVVNTQRARAIKASFQIEGQKVQSGRVFEIADDPMVEVTLLNSADVMRIDAYHGEAHAGCGGMEISGGFGIGD